MTSLRPLVSLQRQACASKTAFRSLSRSPINRAKIKPDFLRQNLSGLVNDLNKRWRSLFFRSGVEIKALSSVPSLRTRKNRVLALKINNRSPGNQILAMRAQSVKFRNVSRTAIRLLHTQSKSSPEDRTENHKSKAEDTGDRSRTSESKKSTSTTPEAEGVRYRTRNANLVAVLLFLSMASLLIYYYDKWLPLVKGSKSESQGKNPSEEDLRKELEHQLKNMKLAKDLIASIKQLKDLANSNNDIIKTLENTIENSHNRSKEDIEKLRTTIDGLVQSSFDSIKKHKDQVDELTLNIDNLKEEKNQLKKEHADDVEKYEAKIKGLNNQIENLSKERDALQSQLDTLKDSHKSIYEYTQKIEALENEKMKISKMLNLYSKCRKEQCFTDVKQLQRGEEKLTFDKKRYFTLEFMQAIQEALGNNLFPVRVLDLEGTNIGNDEGFKCLMKGLANNTTVLSLNLRNTNTCYNEKEGDIDAICDMLKTNTTLKQLNLSYLYINDVQAERLKLALKTNTTLSQIDLSDSSMTASKKQEFKTNFPGRVII